MYGFVVLLKKGKVAFTHVKLKCDFAHLCKVLWFLQILIGEGLPVLFQDISEDINVGLQLGNGHVSGEFLKIL